MLSRRERWVLRETWWSCVMDEYRMTASAWLHVILRGGWDENNIDWRREGADDSKLSASPQCGYPLEATVSKPLMQL